ncbi:unnamed protein product [Periconia digitata]|uniref:Uncharacterized protein n=1 Tax=Periconia digitata TaxID=1303443 RepID=A0A9W4ULJ1_9PLEO|nr:unnamed protein product [Periconia digitata]
MQSLPTATTVPEKSAPAMAPTTVERSRSLWSEGLRATAWTLTRTWFGAKEGTGWVVFSLSFEGPAAIMAWWVWGSVCILCSTSMYSWGTSILWHKDGCYYFFLLFIVKCLVFV